MAQSSILGGERVPRRAPGHDVDALGPSDSSDSGSDVQGERSMSAGPDRLGSLPAERESDSDTAGSGERAAATGDERREGADIAPDRVVSVGTIGEEGVEAGIDDAPDAFGADAGDDDVNDEAQGQDEGGAPPAPARAVRRRGRTAPRSGR